MKLLRNTTDNPYDVNWQETSPFNVPVSESVWLVDVYDDCQLFINGECIAWATWDAGEYVGLARAMPDMLYSMAHVLGFEPIWLSVEFPNTEDDEEHPLADQWEWSDIYEFITTGKYQEVV